MFNTLGQCLVFGEKGRQIFTVQRGRGGERERNRDKGKERKDRFVRPHLFQN